MAAGTTKRRGGIRRRPLNGSATISYFEELAQTAERGLLDAVFFADGQSAGAVGDGPLWFLEPLTALSAMSRATKRIGLVSTGARRRSTPSPTICRVRTSTTGT